MSDIIEFVKVEELPDEHTGGTWTGYRPLLTCGHWGNAVHPQSSMWDFPADPWHCAACDELRQMDVRLQAALYNEWFGEEDDDEDA